MVWGRPDHFHGLQATESMVYAWTKGNMASASKHFWTCHGQISLLGRREGLGSKTQLRGGSRSQRRGYWHPGKTERILWWPEASIMSPSTELQQNEDWPWSLLLHNCSCLAESAAFTSNLIFLCTWAIIQGQMSLYSPLLGQSLWQWTSSCVCHKKSVVIPLALSEGCWWCGHLLPLLSGGRH